MSTCRWSPSCRRRPPPWASSPCSAPSRCLLKRGRGELGLNSGFSMLGGARTMAALVTGPEGHNKTQSQGLAAVRADVLPAARRGAPLRVTVRMLCLLFTSHSRTDSSWEPERRTLPSVDTDRHVTWFLCPLKTFPVFCSGRKLCSLCPGCGVGEVSCQCLGCGAPTVCSLSPQWPLTQLHRSTWKMEPSLPPQNT